MLYLTRLIKELIQTSKRSNYRMKRAQKVMPQKTI